MNDTSPLEDQVIVRVVPGPEGPRLHVEGARVLPGPDGAPVRVPLDGPSCMAILGELVKSVMVGGVQKPEPGRIVLARGGPV